MGYVPSKEVKTAIDIFGYPLKEYKALDKSGKTFQIGQWGMSKKGGIESIDNERGVILHNVTTFKGQ